jgi:hypothetical protein
MVETAFEPKKFNYIDGKNTFNREKFEGVNPSVTQENDAITSNGRLTAAMWNGAATIAVFPAEKF